MGTNNNFLVPRIFLFLIFDILLLLSSKTIKSSSATWHFRPTEKKQYAQYCAELFANFIPKK